MARSIKTKRAFTLMEVLFSFAVVVVAIFAIINFLLVYSNLNQSMQARIKAYTISNSVLNNLLSRNFNDPILSPGSKTYVLQNITITYSVTNITRSGEVILKEINLNARYNVKNRNINNIRLWGVKYKYENIR
ncbi:MAG: PulJ/GspJ family protein [bacterium]